MHELKNKLIDLGFTPQKSDELLKNSAFRKRMEEIIATKEDLVTLHVILAQHSSDINLIKSISKKEIVNEKQIIKILKECKDLSKISEFVKQNTLSEEEIKKIISSCRTKKEAFKILNDKGAFNNLKDLPERVKHLPDQAEKEETFWLKEGVVSKLHLPGENPQLSEEIKNNHLKRTGKKVVTRFPPEPNGHLHIGHAKAMALSFDYAQMYDGITFLRFDDTNPKNEEISFYHSIKEDVEWLGYKPHYITSSSTYFEQMIDFAYRLIESDLAYVCHLTSQEIHEKRVSILENTPENNKNKINELIGGNSYNPFINKENECLTNGCNHKKGSYFFNNCINNVKNRSPFRNRSKEINKILFKEMLEGKWSEGSAVLRLKMEESNNPFMQDLVIYRVINKAHPIYGNKYSAYPSYDFALCICDSLEDVTHSFCSKEFQSRQISYQWLINKLNIYKPVQWEFSRLNVSNTVLSKRKINKLIKEGIISDYDDPRLFTLKGLKKRGFTSESINKFVRSVGITYSESIMDIKLLEQIQRDELNKSAERITCVINPIKLMVNNELIYISKNDYQSKSEDSFLRLTDTQCVGLLNKFNIKVIKKENDILHCEITNDKPKKYIHWIKDYEEITVNLFTYLFNSFDPEENEDYLNDINKDSINVLVGYIDKKVMNDPIGSRYQFMREGYFYKVGEKEFNRIVELKSSFK
ncbi:glutaminyl-tRNA synthetase [Tubulinosema ratisbonensis]|uniref:glutamine--tRNA ligase n=1 Tax=Tubulinosema ratisbonensis TaxID=291195 RepID=A0A437AMZ6_9MICR|nr:glutaminyl-tRNA synthetase [Tubulinosema ratisbonensis]